MVNQNNQLNINLQKIKVLEEENNLLRIKSSQLYSIDNIYKNSSTSAIIKNSIDISEQD